MGTIEKQGRVEALPFSIIKACPNFHKAGDSTQKISSIFEDPCRVLVLDNGHLNTL
jgi:hypothetical protein